MNKNLEIQKIKVSNIDEMFAEMRKWKNSDREWKLLEKHTKWTLGGDRENKDSTSGFILSNGKKKVDIVCEEDDYDLVDLDTIFGGKENWQKLREIFPENETPFLSRKSITGNYYSNLKVIGEVAKEHTTIMRLFNVWTLDDLKKILVDYYVANKAEIDQFTEKNYPQSAGIEALGAQWLEVGEDDKLFYIWVGKRDTKKGYYQGGGEWEICLRKSDLVEKYDRQGNKLIDFTGSERAQKLKSWLGTFLIILTNGGKNDSGNRHLITDFKNYPVGFDPDCCDQNGNLIFPSGKNPNDKDKKPNSVPEKSGSDIQQAEEQVRRFMEQNNVFRLTLEKGKLIVEYKSSSKKEEKEITSELKTIQNYLKEHNDSVNFDQLKSNSSTTTTQSKKPDYIFWTVGGVGVLLVGGILVYWIRKRKNK